MNFLVGSLNKNGELAYFKNNQKTWSMQMNCPKFIAKCDKYYYSFSQGEKVTLYCFEKNNDTFNVKSTIEIDDISVSHLEHSSKHNMLFLSCMDSGFYHTVEVIDGVFTKVISSELLGGKPGKCHQVLLNKSQDKAFIVNMTQNTVYFYDLVNQELKLTDSWEFEDIFPRHLLYTKNEEYLYVVTEKSNEIILLDYKNKKIIQRQLIDLNVLEKAQGATLQRNSDQTILYVSLRGNNIITSFKINEDYTLERIKTFTTFGDNSRDFKISNDDKYLLSPNIKTNEVTIINTSSYELDSKVEFLEPLSIMEVL